MLLHIVVILAQINSQFWDFSCSVATNVSLMARNTPPPLQLLSFLKISVYPGGNTSDVAMVLSK